MKKKLVCLTLSILMLLTCLLTGCNQKKTEEEESTVDNSAKTITMWVMTEEDTTDKAKELVNAEFTKITKAKFKTNVEIKFCTEKEYYTKLEETIKAAQADILLAEEAEKALRQYIKAHKDEDGKDRATLTKEFYEKNPQYAKFAEVEEDEEAAETEEETMVNEFGITEIKYPDAKENQVDIFYLSGYDKYMEYYNGEWLSSLSEELSTSSKKLTKYISASLLSGVQIEGGVYAIPNNVPIGQYTYMMLDKELFDRYYNKIDNVSSVLDISTFLRDMKNLNGELSPEDPNYVVPLASSYEECIKMLCWYWQLEYTDKSVYKTYFDEKTGRTYVLQKQSIVKVETTDENGETVEKEEIVIAPSVEADVVYLTDSEGRFLDKDGNVLNYAYATDEEGGWIYNEKTEKTEYATKGAGALYLIDADTGYTIRPENDLRVRDEGAETKTDANGNTRPTYHYSYNNDCDFSILGAMMKDAAKRTRGGVNVGFNSLFVDAEYREMYSTLKNYQYEGYYGTPVEGQRAAVSFMEGDARIKQEYEEKGVYVDENGKEYYVVVAQYPEATESELYGNMFAVYANSNHLARSMEVITYLNTNAALRNLLQYGILGQHYELNADGTAHLLTSSESEYGTYRMAIEKTGNCFIATPHEDLGADAWVYAKQQNNDSLINPLLGFDFNMATADSDYSLDVALIDHINELSAQAKALVDECTTKAELNDLMMNDEDGFKKIYSSSAGDVKLNKATNNSYDPESPLGPEGGDNQTPDKSGSSPFTVYQAWLTQYGYAASTAKK